MAKPKVTGKPLASTKKPTTSSSGKPAGMSGREWAMTKGKGKKKGLKRQGY